MAVRWGRSSLAPVLIVDSRRSRKRSADCRLQTCRRTRIDADERTSCLKRRLQSSLIRQRQSLSAAKDNLFNKYQLCYSSAFLHLEQHRSYLSIFTLIIDRVTARLLPRCIIIAFVIRTFELLHVRPFPERALLLLSAS